MGGTGPRVTRRSAGQKQLDPNQVRGFRDPRTFRTGGLGGGFRRVDRMGPLKQGLLGGGGQVGSIGGISPGGGGGGAAPQGGGGGGGINPLQLRQQAFRRAADQRRKIGQNVGGPGLAGI